MDPAEQTAQFLSGLPDTIRSNILAFVLIYVFDYPLKRDDDLRAIVIEKFQTPDGMRRIAIVLRATGVIDFVLERTIFMQRANEARLPIIAQKLENDAKAAEIIETMMMSRELQLRHAETALQTWTSLRSNELSPGNLMAFEDSCLKGSLPA
ncbi:hypothetical protein [uncultured Rhodoblastus sp.]|uniref:hypothetical protein n=1 Tax=uncultured Rhodoblastus sp. TaxID=543037 RepID=UPI0025D7D9B2|nr:hypothetical protein [uncultured Rhodoblastus sp.]